MFGSFGPVMGLSAIAGPIVAGVLIDANLFGTGWRLVFLINVPVAWWHSSPRQGPFPAAYTLAAHGSTSRGMLLIGLARWPSSTR